MDIIKNLIANLLERAFGSKPSVLLTITGLLAALAAFLTAWQPNPFPPSYQPYLIAVAGVLGGVAGILGHGSKTAAKALLFAILLVPFHLAAQSKTETPVQNFYAAGGSYNFGAAPSVAGTALYAHAIINADGSYPTYAFTAIDALPATVKPFTVSSNIGIGVAQKVANLGKVNIFMPTSAGISFNGGNTGWQWNGGVLAAIPIKNGYYVAPTVRFLKSSVSGGTGYQPIIGVLFGWGK